VGPSGRAVGIDLAPEMVAAARQRAGDRQQVEFAVGDVDSLGLPRGSFDVALSRWGLMFSVDRDRMFRSLRELLAPGGVLAAAVSVTEYLVPFRLASPQRYADFINEMTPPPLRKALRERFGDENDPGTWQAVAEAAMPYFDTDGWVSLPSSTLLIRAAK
jgi:enediyne biosynthesis protein CalE5